MASLLRLFLFIFSQLLHFSHSLENSYESIGVKNFKLWKCDTNTYPVAVTNVKIQSTGIRLGGVIHLKFSGTLSTDIDLESPIKADLSIERDELGIWIPVPCVDNIGSCTYNDLCKFGIPKTKNCPEPFSTNSVPCRCPISQGNYTIEPTYGIQLPQVVGSIYSGTYKGVVKVKNSNTTISCYNVYFQLYDRSTEYNIVF